MGEEDVVAMNRKFKVLFYYIFFLELKIRIYGILFVLFQLLRKANWAGFIKKNTSAAAHKCEATKKAEGIIV